MTLVQKDNIKLERPVPQWKKELITRKKASLTKAGSYQIMINNTFGHVGKQRDVIITANERAVDHSRQPDFHLQQRASFGIAQRLFVPAVDNMKLLNEVGARDSTVKSRARISNVSKTECVRENYVKHVVEMNEEKCYDKFRFGMNKFSPNSKVKIRSLSPPANNEEDNTSDSSEELQYGPGIVNKLKTKYLSMTLRENQKKGVRPSLSNMRKATSLDNLLDEDIMNTDKPYQISSVISCVNKLEYSNKESEACLTLNFCADLKRARSMETLHDDKKESQNSSNIKSIVVSKTKVTNQSKPSVKVYNNGLTLLPLESIVNEDIIIVENTISEPKNDTRKRNSFENRELPPPDVVKETLKIFENCQKKSSNCKSWSCAKFNSAPRSPEINSKPKVEAKKHVCGKPVLYPKPVINSIDTKLKKFPPKKPIVDTNSNGIIKQVINTEHSDKQNGIVQNGFSTEEKQLNLKNNCTKLNHAEDIDTRSSSPVSVLKISFQSNKSPEPVNQSLPNNVTSNCDKNTADVISMNSKNSQKSRSVVSPVVEKLNGTHINTSPKKLPEKLIIENHVAAKTPTIVENEVEDNVIRNQTVNDNENKYKHDILKPSEGLPVRQVGIIRPLVSTKLNNTQSTLTPQEIEKNFINTKKTLDLAEKSNRENEKDDSSENISLCSKEQSVVNFNNSPNNVNKPSTLWFNKPWNQQENTMVFNFRDRKEVPDYIENDGLLLTSNRDRAKRILQETGGSGYIILGVENSLDSSINESSTDSPSISCREEWHLISGPPSPCNIHFEGDNVVINGKSNLRKHPREKKLRIQFNDTSTTFEYPSEASLLEEDISSITNGNDESVSSPELNIVPSSTPNVSAHLSGSSLASYVPSKLSMGECFELGITRSNGSMANVVNSRVADKKLENTCAIQQNENSIDYLKPASENDNIAWSEESSPDLLF